MAGSQCCHLRYSLIPHITDNMIMYITTAYQLLVRHQALQ